MSPPQQHHTGALPDTSRMKHRKGYSEVLIFEASVTSMLQPSQSKEIKAFNKRFRARAGFLTFNCAIVGWVGREPVHDWMLEASGIPGLWPLDANSSAKL